MKNQKGITLIALTIYIIALTFIIAILATVSTFFYKNVNDSTENLEPLTEFTSFNTYFLQDINNESIKIKDVGDTTQNNKQYKYIILDNVNLSNEDSNKYIKYIYVQNDKAIYRDTGNNSSGDKTTINICRGVDNCTFTLSQQANENNKAQIAINIEINGKTEEYTYTLAN